MRELYLNLIKAQDHLILSADKADELGLVDLSARLEAFRNEVGQAIGKIQADEAMS